MAANPYVMPRCRCLRSSLPGLYLDHVVVQVWFRGSERVIRFYPWVFMLCISVSGSGMYQPLQGSLSACAGLCRCRRLFAVSVKDRVHKMRCITIPEVARVSACLLTLSGRLSWHGQR